mgnify:CR=1 FL=1|jgi:hypothetical protein
MYKIKDMAFDTLYFFIYEIKKKQQFILGMAVGYIIGVLV